MQTENVWKIEMVSEDRHSFEFCAVALTEEIAREKAYAIIKKNLWESFNYKINRISYLGDKNGR